MSADKTKPQDHPLWPEFQKWVGDEYKNIRIAAVALAHNPLVWKAFLTGAKIGAQKAIERMARERVEIDAEQAERVWTGE